MFKAAPFDIVLAVSIFVAKAFERVLFKTLVDRIRPYRSINAYFCFVRVSNLIIILLF